MTLYYLELNQLNWFVCWPSITVSICVYCITGLNITSTGDAECATFYVLYTILWGHVGPRKLTCWSIWQGTYDIESDFQREKAKVQMFYSGGGRCNHLLQVASSESLGISWDWEILSQNWKWLRAVQLRLQMQSIKLTLQQLLYTEAAASSVFTPCSSFFKGLMMINERFQAIKFSQITYSTNFCCC